MNGQTNHKIEWVDLVTTTFVNEITKIDTIDTDSVTTSYRQSPTTTLPEFVFISHSIGAQLVQSLCILRKDILVRTRAVVHIMPFFRFDPYPRWKKTYMSTVANTPNLALGMLSATSKIASFLPKTMIDKYLKYITGMSVAEDRELARKLMTNSHYARNFLTLGMEEIRDLPEKHDVQAMKIIGEHSPSFILYCGNGDHWAPKFHLEEIQHDINTGVLPKNIILDYVDGLQHDFVVHPEMHSPVVDFVCKAISHAACKNPIHLTSKL